MARARHRGDGRREAGMVEDAVATEVLLNDRRSTATRACFGQRDASRVQQSVEIRVAASRSVASVRRGARV